MGPKAKPAPAVLTRDDLIHKLGMPEDEADALIAETAAELRGEPVEPAGELSSDADIDTWIETGEAPPKRSG